MAHLEEGLYSYLTGITAITDLVSTRIYPDKRDQESSLPAISYFVVTRERFPAQENTPALVRALVQFDSWSSTDVGALNVAKEIRLALNGKRNLTMGTLTGVNSNIDDERKIPDDDPDIYHVASEFLIWHQEDLS